jgi:DnaJ-class molecular chaperone
MANLTDADLSKDSGISHAPPHYGPFGFMSVAAHAKLKPADPTFMFLNWRYRRDGHHMQGAPTKLRTRGKLKGKPRFNGTMVTVIVTDEEVAATKSEYEQSTGYCSECVGSGKELAAWDHKEGVFYRDCRKCNGSGKCQP